MSVAGAGSIIICKSQFPFKEKRQPNENSNCSFPVIEETKVEYQPTVTQRRRKTRVELSADDGWRATSRSTRQRARTYYYLWYGLERYASLANMKLIDAVEWLYLPGARFIAETVSRRFLGVELFQLGGHKFCPVVPWSIHAKTITCIQITRLGRGTMVGGRGLPDPSGTVSGLAARRSARYNRALKAPVEELLSALDDEDPANVESAAVALETADPQEILRAVKGNKAKLRLLARHPRPEVRAGALWALARTKDLRTAPVLIQAIGDADPNVYRASRGALRFLSQRMDAFGMPGDPPPSTERDRWAKVWKKWYDSLNVQVDPQQEFNDPVTTTPATP
ncbi:MAG: HEAT repeat domain-containing protein [Planctomycetota bacterium]